MGWDDAPAHVCRGGDARGLAFCCPPVKPCPVHTKLAEIGMSPQEFVNIKQEFGKWFLDVAKYVLTAMLLTSMIEGLSQAWLISVAASVTLLCLIFGGVLISSGRKEEDRIERNRQRHRDKVRKGGK